MSIKYTYYFAIISLFFISYNTTLAWNKVGHLVGSEYAYRLLNKKDQQQLNAILMPLDNQLSMYRRNTRDYQNNISKLAILNSYPDKWRNHSFVDIMQKYSNGLPAKYNIDFYTNPGTGKWHYIDQSYPHACSQNLKRINITQAYKNLLDLYQQRGLSTTNKAIILVFISHLILDAHQPLHAITKTDAYCNGDRGGNNFCLRYKQSRRNKLSCRLNLHQFWDSAGLWLKPKVKITHLVTALDKITVNNNKYDLYDDLNLNSWLQEDYNLAATVYDVQPNHSAKSSLQYKTTKGYQYRRITRRIAKQRLILAAHRLANVLHKLLNSQI